MSSGTGPGRKVRYAVVGGGWISQAAFMPGVAQTGNSEIAALVTGDPKKARVLGERYGIKTWSYDQYGEALTSGTFDAIYLALPNGMHRDSAVPALEAGKHLLLEKPMATKWDEGVAMVRACRDAGVKLFVVKQNRLNATLQLVKRAVDQGRFGRISLVNVNVFWTRPQAYYDAAPWRGRWDLDGGAFMNQASHYVDMVDWLVGPVDNVHAYTATLGRDIEAEDTGVMSLRLRSGALASVNVTMLTYNKNFEGSITLLGERGTVRVGGQAVNKIEHWEFDAPHADDALVADASYGISSVYGPGHPLYYDNVIRTLRGEAHAEVDGYEGLRSLEVLIAAYRSARDGVRVGLPLVF